MYVVKYSIYQDQDMKISISALMKQMLLVFIQAFTSNHCWNTVVTYKDVQISHFSFKMWKEWSGPDRDDRYGTVERYWDTTVSTTAGHRCYSRDLSVCVTSVFQLFGDVCNHCNRVIEGDGETACFKHLNTVQHLHYMYNGLRIYNSCVCLTLSFVF